MTFALLRTRLHKTAIEQLCHEIETDESGKRKEELFALLSDNEKRVAEQAAWVMTHLKKNEDQWLQQKQNELIDKLLQTESNTMKRLLLALLLRTEFTQEDERGDFLEYCMARILQLKEPVGVRMACMKLAYEQCKFYPELLQELRMTLEIMPSELLTAGLRSSQKHVLQKINRQLKTFETKPVGN